MASLKRRRPSPSPRLPTRRRLILLSLPQLRKQRTSVNISSPPLVYPRASSHTRWYSKLFRALEVALFVGISCIPLIHMIWILHLLRAMRYAVVFLHRSWIMSVKWLGTVETESCFRVCRALRQMLACRVPLRRSLAFHGTRYPQKCSQSSRRQFSGIIESMGQEFLDLATALPYPSGFPPYSSTIILVTIFSRLLTVPVTVWVRVFSWMPIYMLILCTGQ